MQFCGILHVRGLNQGGMDIINCNSPIKLIVLPVVAPINNSLVWPITNKIMNFRLFPLLFY